MEVNDMNKKWYIVINTGEDLRESVVELNDEEATAVETFLNDQIEVYCGEYAPTMEFYGKPWDTKEDAVKALNNGSCYEYKL